MPYLALYRKLRPTRFEDVVGQEHVVTTLQNQISSGRVAHAYLFVGTRGTGKTTLAKVFARAINCLEASSNKSEACGGCEACQASQSNVSPNIIEIDAASNNSVDNIRDLREEIRHAPISGSYKVLIIDEVHMLSTGAFNALLKTLEEPPAHVFFILATTEAHRIPATILSRCQRFDFRRISPREMTAALRGYMDSEGIGITDDALAYVTQLSDGAMRDALSLLDRASALYQDTITIENLRELTGAVDEGVYQRLTEALQAADSRTCLDIIDEAVMSGRDVTQFVNEYVRHLRGLMIAQPSDSQPLRLLTRFVELSAQLRHLGNERIALEIACVRLCCPELQVPATSNAETSAQRPQPANQPVSSAPKPQTEAQTLPELQVKPTPPTVTTPPSPPSSAVPDDIKAAIKNFGALADRFRMPVKGMLKKSSARHTGGDFLTIITPDECVETLEKRKDMIKAELAVMFKKDIDVVIVSAEKLGGQQHSAKSSASLQNSKIDETVLAEVSEVFGDDIVEIR